MQVTIPCIFRKAPSNADLDKIRQDAGNPELTADDVIVFGKSMIGRSDIPGNRFLFTSGSLQSAAPTFIGKAVNLDHQYKQASQQVARIFDAWAEESAGVTYLYVNTYAVKTADLADIHTRMFNRQHRDMSMGAAISAAHCSLCNQDVVPHDLVCPKHGGQADYLTVVDGFEGEHLSFVGDPAIEGAQLLNARNESQRDHTLRRLANDGQVFRDWAVAEFSKWYRLNNRDATQDEINTLTEHLSARQMVNLARIEQSRFQEIIPSGKQQLQAPQQETEQPTAPQFKRITDIFKNRSL